MQCYGFQTEQLISLQCLVGVSEVLVAICKYKL